MLMSININIILFNNNLIKQINIKLIKHVYYLDIYSKRKEMKRDENKQTTTL